MEKARPAWELEAEARAINATDWEPLPGMGKRQCPECSYFFAARPRSCAVPIAWLRVPGDKVGRTSNGHALGGPALLGANQSNRPCGPDSQPDLAENCGETFKTVA